MLSALWSMHLTFFYKKEAYKWERVKKIVIALFILLYLVHLIYERTWTCYKICLFAYQANIYVVVALQYDDVMCALSLSHGIKSSIGILVVWSPVSQPSDFFFNRFFSFYSRVLLLTMRCHAMRWESVELLLFKCNNEFIVVLVVWWWWGSIYFHDGEQNLWEDRVLRRVLNKILLLAASISPHNNMHHSHIKKNWEKSIPTYFTRDEECT